MIIRNYRGWKLRWYVSDKYSSTPGVKRRVYYWEKFEGGCKLRSTLSSSYTLALRWVRENT